MCALCFARLSKSARHALQRKLCPTEPPTFAPDPVASIVGGVVVVGSEAGMFVEVVAPSRYLGNTCAKVISL